MACDTFISCDLLHLLSREVKAKAIDALHVEKTASNIMYGYACQPALE